MNRRDFLKGVALTGAATAIGGARGADLPKNGGMGSSRPTDGGRLGPTITNWEFRSAKKVAPFTVYTRPTRASGWVNLRWAPSKTAEILSTYKANAALTVLQEMTNWYQVEDSETGLVGFVDKNFVNQ